MATGAETVTEVLDQAAPGLDAFKDDGKPYTPPESPAISLHADLMPEIPESVRLADELKKFPNPQGPLRELFSHQIEAAERIALAWQEGDGVVLQDEAGLGKTVSALAAIMARGEKRNLIVVPVSGKENLKKQWTDAAALYGLPLKTMDDGFEGDGTWIISYDELTFKPEASHPDDKPKAEIKPELLQSGRWGTLTFDEAHNMKNPAGVRTKAAKRLQAEASDKVLYMSATPYTNIADMHYLTKLGHFYDDKSFLEWAEHAGARIEGKKIHNPSSPLPMAAVAATFHVDGKTIKRFTSLEGVTSGFEMLSHDQLNEGAKKTFETVDAIVAEAIASGLPESIIKALYVGWARQYWETQKAERAIELGKQAISEGKQVAFFTSFKSADHQHIRAIARWMIRKGDQAEQKGDLRAAQDWRSQAVEIIDKIEKLPKVPDITETLTNAFGGPSQVSEIHGNTNKKASAEQEKYQAGKTKVVVATMAKGGTGISLHDTVGDAPRVQINLSLPWSGTEFTQVAGRSHRLGSKSSTTMHWLVGDSYTELNNATIVANRLKSMGSLTAGDPEFNVDAATLASWDFADNSTATESDDPDAIINAMADAMEAVGDADMKQGAEVLAPKGKRKKSEEAQAARDYFREFAEARRSGRNVLDEENNRRKEAKAKAMVVEARRSNEQINKEHGFRGTYEPSTNEFLFNWSDVPQDLNYAFKDRRVKGSHDYALRAIRVPAEGMQALSEKLGADKHKIDLREVAASEAKAASEAEAKKKELEAIAEKASAELPDMQKLFRTKGLILSENPVEGHGTPDPVHLIYGQTFPVKDTIKAAGARWDGNNKGWKVRRSAIPGLARKFGLTKSEAALERWERESFWIGQSL